MIKTCYEHKLWVKKQDDEVIWDHERSFGVKQGQKWTKSINDVINTYSGRRLNSDLEFNWWQFVSNGHF